MQRKSQRGAGLGRGRFVAAVAIAGVALAAALHGVAAPVVTTAVYGPGDLDPDFGSGGSVDATFVNGQNASPGQKIAVQADSKIIVVGVTQVSSTNWDWAVTRFLTSGAKDNSFGNGGTVVTQWNKKFDAAARVAIQPDGKTLVAGIYTNNTHRDFALARYNLNGSLDASFGSGGKVSTDIGKRTDDEVWELLLQPDGKMVVVGSASGLLALVRYNTNGSPDSTFDGDGKVTQSATQLGVTSFAVPRAAMQSDGRILVSLHVPGTTVLVRFNANGSRDTSYGSGGIAATGIPGSQGGSIAVQADDKAVVEIEADEPVFNSVVVRLNTDGTLDTSFNGTGWRKLLGFDWSQDVHIQADGKILVICTDAFNRLGVIARLNTDGTLDSTFGVDGIATDVGSTNWAHGWSVATQPNGGIIGLVVRGSSGDTYFTLSRFLEDDPALLIAPNPIPVSGNVALAVAETHGLNGPILGVDFWLDVDGDAVLDDAIDQLLSAGSYSSTFDVWETSGPNPAPVGTATFFAVTHYAGGHTVVAQQAEVVP